MVYIYARHPLPQFLQHKVTENYTSPPGWDTCPLQHYPQVLSLLVHLGVSEEGCYENEVSCPRPQLVHCDIYINFNAYCSRHEYPLPVPIFLTSVTRFSRFCKQEPQRDHNIIENINKLTENLLSFTWFVFLSWFSYLVRGSTAVLYWSSWFLRKRSWIMQIFLLFSYKYQQGRQLFHKAIWTPGMKSLWTLFLFTSLQPKSKQTKTG